MSLLRSARGVFDTGAAPTSAAFPDQADTSPTVSRHGSGELRPTVSRHGSGELRTTASRHGSGELRPTVSRHGSGELRPYVSPFAKPPSPSRQSSTELQMVATRSASMDRQASIGTLQQLPVHTGQTPVRCRPGSRCLNPEKAPAWLLMLRP